MHKPEEIEAILGRLMPPALSDDGRRGIDSMLDQLAGGSGDTEEVQVPPVARPWFKRIVGIAAAGVFGALVFSFDPAGPETVAVLPTAPEFILVNESNRIESIHDEGWQEADDGSTVRAMRLSVVEENSFFDEETGLVVQVSEPREEIVFMPVSTF